MERIEIVGKIGSMAMVRQEKNDIDYNIISSVAEELRPGVVWVTSGAAEIGRLDYMRRAGHELTGDPEEIKADYCAQGQAILTDNYRRFAPGDVSLRQVLVEHQHFNDPIKRQYIKKLLLRAAAQNAVPIVNYNDTVSDEEIRKMELNSLRMNQSDVVECVDNDETAAVICNLVEAKYLVILSTTEGIYRDPADSCSLVQNVSCPNAETLIQSVRSLQESCVGASRAGANGARAKLEYALEAALRGSTVVIGSARYGMNALLRGDVPHTRIGINNA